MKQTVLLNGLSIEVDQLEIEASGEKVSMTFQVTHKDYHDITSLLYKNDFLLEIPSEKLILPVKINKYATSIDNLYEEDAVGTFYVELVKESQKKT